MSSSGSAPRFNPRLPAKPKRGAWGVYRRLLGYVWQHGLRLFFALLFGLLVAGSFGSMIVGMSKVTVVLVGANETATLELDRDVERIHNAEMQIERMTGVRTSSFSESYRNLVVRMRQAREQALVFAAVLMMSITVLIAAGRYLQEFFAGSIGAHICTQLGEEMFDSLIAMSHDFFDRTATSEIMARFTNDMFIVNRGLTGVLVKILIEPIKLSGFIAIALYTDASLALFGICVLPPVALVVLRIGRKVKKSVRRLLQNIAAMAGILSEAFSGISIVKGFSTETFEAARLQKELTNLRRYMLRIVRADAAIGPSSEILLTAAFVIFVVISGRKVIQGELDSGDFVALYASLALMLEPVRKLSAVNNQIQTSAASAERVFEYIDLIPTIVESPNAIDLKAITNGLRFNDVRFAYEGRDEVLHGVSFEVRKGEMLAIVGFSGAGKSTIAKLIPRFYDVTGGSITIDGVDIRDATFKSLRGQIGIVPQEIVLFDRSVKDNIAFALGVYAEDKVFRAAQAAHAAEFISGLPAKYDTVIGERGATLSGGQRQRLAIARALVKDPSILILDEATSSLDSESEQAIQKAIEEFVVGRTTVVIAHRLSTVRRADRILVINDGLIVEEGSHDELMQMNGMYRRLYEVQFATQSSDASE